MMKKILTTAFVLTMMTGIAALADVSTEAKLQYNQGLDYYRLGQYEQAVNSFKNAISIEPNYIDAYYNLGVVLQQTNKNAEALGIFKQIIVRNPNDYEAIYNAAALSAKLGQTENAKKYLAIIPANSPIMSKAKVLAASLNTDIETISSELETQANINTPKIPQTNGDYTNLASPTGVTTDKYGNLYVASFSNNSITKITPTGARSDFVKNAALNGPIDMEADGDGNIYVANYNTDNIVKISPSGTITQLLGNVKKPYCLHINGDMLFISSQGTNTVIRYKL